MATKMRAEMLEQGREDEPDALVREARALQDRLLARAAHGPSKP